MALTEKDIEEIEYEVWVSYQDNPLPRMEQLLPALKNPDNVHFGKKIALAFVEAIDYGYVSKENFKEYGYSLSEEGKLDFADGSSLIFDEGRQSFKLLNFN